MNLITISNGFSLRFYNLEKQVIAVANIANFTLNFPTVVLDRLRIIFLRKVQYFSENYHFRINLNSNGSRSRVVLSM